MNITPLTRKEQLLRLWQEHDESDVEGELAVIQIDKWVTAKRFQRKETIIMDLTTGKYYEIMAHRQETDEGEYYHDDPVINRVLRIEPPITTTVTWKRTGD